MMKKLLASMMFLLSTLVVGSLPAMAEDSQAPVVETAGSVELSSTAPEEAVFGASADETVAGLVGSTGVVLCMPEDPNYCLSIEDCPAGCRCRYNCCVAD